MTTFDVPWLAAWWITLGCSTIHWPVLIAPVCPALIVRTSLGASDGPVITFTWPVLTV